MKNWMGLCSMAALGALLILGLLLASGCGADLQEVGASCDYHGECAERCLSGRRFPEGMCSISCDDDYDCPRDTYCIDRDGGVCLPGCERHGDCRGGYECSRQSRYGSGGEARVCIAD